MESLDKNITNPYIQNYIRQYVDKKQKEAASSSVSVPIELPKDEFKPQPKLETTEVKAVEPAQDEFKPANQPVEESKTETENKSTELPEENPESVDNADKETTDNQDDNKPKFFSTLQENIKKLNTPAGIGAITTAAIALAGLWIVRNKLKTAKVAKGVNEAEKEVHNPHPKKEPKPQNTQKPKEKSHKPAENETSKTETEPLKSSKTEEKANTAAETAQKAEKTATPIEKLNNFTQKLKENPLEHLEKDIDELLSLGDEHVIVHLSKQVLDKEIKSDKEFEILGKCFDKLAKTSGKPQGGWFSKTKPEDLIVQSVEKLMINGKFTKEHANNLAMFIKNSNIADKIKFNAIKKLTDIDPEKNKLGLNTYIKLLDSLDKTKVNPNKVNQLKIKLLKSSVEKASFNVGNVGHLADLLNNSGINDNDKLLFMDNLYTTFKKNCYANESSANAFESMLKAIKNIEAHSFIKSSSFLGVEQKSKFSLLTEIIDVLSRNTHTKLENAGFKNGLDLINYTKDVYKKTKKAWQASPMDSIKYHDYILPLEISLRGEKLFETSNIKEIHSETDEIINIAAKILKSTSNKDITAHYKQNLQAYFGPILNKLDKKVEYNSLYKYTHEKLYEFFRANIWGNSNSHTMKKPEKYNLTELLKTVELPKGTKLTPELHAKHKRRLANKYHPDRVGTGSEEARKAAEEKFKDINDALDELEKLL